MADNDKNKKIIDLSKYLNAPKLDYEKPLDEQDSLKEFDDLNQKKWDGFGDHLETKGAMNLQDMVHELMGENINFAHIKEEKKRKAEVDKFTESIIDHSMESFYINLGIPENQVKSIMESIKKDPGQMDYWGMRVFGEGGKKGFVKKIMDNMEADPDINIRDFLANPEVYKELYELPVKNIDPVSEKKKRLHNHLAIEKEYEFRDYGSKKFGYEIKKSVKENKLLGLMVHGAKTKYKASELLKPHKNLFTDYKDAA